MSLLDKASLIVTPNSYKESKLYSVVPNTTLGDMDVVRATTATRVNSAGLIEVVPRNLLTYSEQFDNAAWSKLRSTITVNATTSPDGTQNADKIVENTANNSHGIDSPSVSVTSGISYTSSVFAKASERRYLFLALNYTSFTSGNGVCFDLQTGTIVATGTGSSSAGTITNFGNGWYRCTITLIATATSSSVALPAIYMGNAVSSNLPAYIGDGISGLFIWGAQTEQGSTATEYFPTTTRLNIPRIDYTNGSCPSLLVEPQRTNVLNYSEDFSSTRGWNPSNAGGSTTTYTSNYGIAPDGTNSADRIQLALNGGPYADWLLFSPTITIGQTYTYSIYIKSLTTNCNIIFLGAITGGNIAKNITTEWVKHTYTFVANNAFCVPRFLIEAGTSTSADILVWGYQLELGSYPTSYIPTVASSVTRNADAISETGISSLIGQTEGTMFLDLVFPQKNDAAYIGISNGTTANRIIFGVEAGDFYTFGYGSDTFPLSINTRYKIALAYNSTNMLVYINGVLSKTITGSVPSGMNRFAFDNGGNGQRFIGTINSAQLYKTKLSTTELAQLTTL